MDRFFAKLVQDSCEDAKLSESFIQKQMSEGASSEKSLNLKFLETSLPDTSASAGLRDSEEDLYAVFGVSQVIDKSEGRKREDKSKSPEKLIEFICDELFEVFEEAEGKFRIDKA